MPRPPNSDDATINLSIIHSAGRAIWEVYTAGLQHTGQGIVLITIQQQSGGGTGLIAFIPRREVPWHTWLADSAFA